jgi:tetratricopeptide (TPR) repeat protein
MSSQKIIRNSLLRLLLINVFFSFITNSAEIQKEVNLIPILSPNRFVLIDAGLVNVDYSVLQKELLELKENVTSFSEKEQAFYYYHLARVNRKLNLSSDYVIPNIEKALSFKDVLNRSELFNMLYKAHEFSSDYTFYEKSLQHLDNIKKLYPNDIRNDFHMETSDLYISYAKVYNNSREYSKAIDIIQSLILKAERSKFKLPDSWLVLLTLIYENNKNIDSAVSCQIKLVKLYPTEKNEKKLRSLLKKQAKNHVIVSSD